MFWGEILELSDLTGYAAEKYHIYERHLWASFPGFSVLLNPDTGKWIALLMRQWDSDLGEEIQRCDLKCGSPETADGDCGDFLTRPFRMKGQKWVGIRMDDSTDKEAVFHLFDRAVHAGTEQKTQLGYTIVLDEKKSGTRIGNTNVGAQNLTAGSRGTAIKYPYCEEDIPEKILQMQRLYRYGGSSFRLKCENFFRQGKFMEEYEDDAPWDGKYLRYFPTYHDLNLRQLRGYFTWRTCLRKGEYKPIATSLAYIYLYELLCGIGTGSPENALQKMREFERGFLDSEIGDQGMRRNLHRWMLDFCVLHNLPVETAGSCADPSVLEQDHSLAVLRDPDNYCDEEIFGALCSFESKKLQNSPVIKKEKEKGRHLFAAVWREAAQKYNSGGKDLFTAIFGTLKVFEWHPLANTIHREEVREDGFVYTLDPCRSYRYHNGIWTQRRYESLFFDKKKMQSFLRGTDRNLRKILKTGYYLREKEDEEWVQPYVEAAVAADKEEEKRARIAEIRIDATHLQTIRQDADITRDSLLMEEETGEEPYSPANLQSSEDGNKIDSLKEKSNNERYLDSDTDSDSDPYLSGLNPLYIRVLQKLLRGESPEGDLKAAHVLPSVAADQINEALFDEIGDTILTCEGDSMELVEDYREDLEGVVGGRYGDYDG